MFKDLIKLIKENTGKCKDCNKRFVAWEYNWDGALVLNLCKKCNQEKRVKEEKEYQDNFNKAQKIGKEVLVATGQLVGWTYQGQFYENPNFISEYDPNIDDYIRQERKKGVKEFLWEPSKFVALQEFVARCGFGGVWDKNEFDYMGVKHRLNV